GEGGRLEADLIPVGVRCLFNALRFLRMLPGALEAPSETVMMSRFIGLRASRGGLLHTTARLGTRVQQGGILARSYSVCGDEGEPIRAALAGRFVRRTTVGRVAEGGRRGT